MDSVITLPRPESTPLPVRARALFIFDNVLLFGLLGIALGVGVFVLFAIGMSFQRVWPVSAVLGLLGVLFGIYRGIKIHRRFLWRLDEDSLDIRKGHMWTQELRVPIQRVQHLNLSRGPLQRSRQLATLTVYTAGTANSSVKMPNMDSDTAERIREHLSARIDWVDE